MGLKATIVVLPQESLMLDIKRRCLDFGVRVERWTPCMVTLPTTFSCVLVSADQAATTTFGDWLLTSQEYVQRIVVDEAHMLVHAANFRYRMREAALVRTIDTPLVLLTATLPPSEENTLLHAVKACSNVKRFRGVTNRPNIKFSVETYSKKSEALVRMRALIQTFNPIVNDYSSARMIIYNRSKVDAKFFSKYERVTLFTSETPEKGNVLNEWFEGKYPIISATSALSLGIDYPAVSLVVHFGSANNFLDFAQETGRAGRNGSLAKSVLISWQGNKCGLQTYVNSTGCRRLQLQDYLDGKGVNTACNTDDHPCDNCCMPTSSTVATIASPVITSVSSHNSLRAANECFSRQTARLVRDETRHTIVTASGYLKEKAGFCGACAAHGSFVRHTMFRCPRARSRCLRCFSASHKASNCPCLAVMRPKGICFKCHLPPQLRGTNTHLNGCLSAGQRCSVLEKNEDFILPFVIQRLSPNGMSPNQAKQWFALKDGVPHLITLFVGLM